MRRQYVQESSQILLQKGTLQFELRFSAPDGRRARDRRRRPAVCGSFFGPTRSLSLHGERERERQTPPFYISGNNNTRAVGVRCAHYLQVKIRRFARANKNKKSRRPIGRVYVRPEVRSATIKSLARFPCDSRIYSKVRNYRIIIIIIIIARRRRV